MARPPRRRAARPGAPGGTAGAGPGRHRAAGRRSASRDPATNTGWRRGPGPGRRDGPDRARHGRGGRPGTRRAGCHRALPRARRPAAALGPRLLLRDRGRGDRAGAGGQGPARALPAGQHAEGTHRGRADAGAEARRHRGDLGAGRGRDPEQGRPGQGARVPGVRPVPGPAADFRQRRGDRPRPGDRVLRQGRGHDERRGPPAPGRRHRGQAAQRAERQGPAHLRLRPGPVRPAGADHAGVHADRGHPDRDVPAAPPPLDRVVQPEHDAQHLPRRPRRQDRLDHRVRDHVHRLGPAGRPHADRDPHALRPAHRDEGRRQAAELGLRHGWEGHPGRHAGPAAARRGGRPRRPRSRRPAAARASPGPRSEPPRGTPVIRPPAPSSPAASRTSGWLRRPASPPSRCTAGIGALVLAALVAGGVVVLLRRRPGEEAHPVLDQGHGLPARAAGPGSPRGPASGPAQPRRRASSRSVPGSGRARRRPPRPGPS